MPISSATSAQKTLKGTVLKMAVDFTYSGDANLTLDDINFYTEWYTQSRKATVTKEEHVREEDPLTGDVTYYAYVDTSITGAGVLKGRLWADIPDLDAPGAVRPEYVEVTTNIVIS